MTAVSDMKSFTGVRLTRNCGRPSMKGVNVTRMEIAAEYARAKTTHDAFPLGHKFGFASAVIKTAKFIALHDAAAVNIANIAALDPQWVFDYPIRPDTYDPNIVGGMGDIARRRREAEQSEAIAQYDLFEEYESAFKSMIEDAYDAAYLATLRDDILGFGHVTTRDMIEHLEQQCLALTSREKTIKLRDTLIPWDQNDDVTTYFVKLEKLDEELLNEFNIEWPESQKLNQAVNEMYESNQFTQDNMMDWEDKTDAQKTWIHCQAYFGRLWTKNQRYGGTTARRHGFESAANVSEQKMDETETLGNNLRAVAVAATADKEHIQQMSDSHDEMLAIIKKGQAQTDDLLKQNAALIKQNADLISALGHLDIGKSRTRSKERTAPADTDTKSETCGLCGGPHPTKRCWELKSNKDRRPVKWKSRLGKDE
jgi:hypothetical protein